MSDSACYQARQPVMEPGSLRAQVRQWFRPSLGLHIVFLGPDGVGKSTVISEIGARLAAEFRGVERASFVRTPWARHPPAPGALDDPHGLPTRSLIASLLKAAFWITYYSVGCIILIVPRLRRSTLILHDRYLVDVLVDPRRYRYGGPRWITSLAWRLARKPDLVILLDAPPEMIYGRKAELPLTEIARQRHAYLELIAQLSNGYTVDAAQPLLAVVADVERLVRVYMTKRRSGRCASESYP